MKTIISYLAILTFAATIALAIASVALAGPSDGNDHAQAAAATPHAYWGS